jgi:uncharacterized protein
MNTDTVRNMYAAFGRGEIPVLLAQMDEKILWTIHSPPVVPAGGEYRGRATIGQWFKTLAETEEFTRFEPQLFFENGPHVAVVGVYEGIAKPTGRKWSSRWLHLWTFGADGKVSEFEDIHDSFALAKAFG